jgi:hypothetical protein
MANATIEIEIKALDRATKKLDSISKSLNPLKGRVGKVEKAFNDVDRSIGKVEKSSGRLKGAFGALAGVAAGIGLVGLAKGAIETTLAYEGLNTQLVTYLGSQDKATAELARLQKLADNLPQDLDDISKAFVILTRTGVDTSNEAVTALSNVATANAKSFDQLAEALADSLTGEFERLKEFGIKVGKENGKFVADFGKGNKQVFDSAQEVTDAVIALGMEGGKFGNAAKVNADTLSQSFSNLQGSISVAQRAFGEGAKGGLKIFADTLSTLIRDNQDLIKSLGEGLGNALASLPDAFAAVKGVMEDLEPVFSLLSTIATEIVVPLGKLAFETLVGLAEAIGPVAEKWIPLLKDAFVGIASAIAGTVTAAFEGIKATIQGVMDFITSAVDTAMAAYNTIKGVTTGIKDGAVAIGNKAADMGGAVVDAGGELITGAVDVGKGWYDGITGYFSDTSNEVVDNSIVPDMVTAIGQWMDQLPNKMALPAQFAADGVVDAMNRMSQSIMNISAISSQSGFTSPVSGIGATSGPVSSAVNFNISGINLNNNEKPTPEMKRYIEGVATQIAYKAIRQNTNFGGLR